MVKCGQKYRKVVKSVGFDNLAIVGIAIWWMYGTMFCGGALLTAAMCMTLVYLYRRIKKDRRPALLKGAVCCAVWGCVLLVLPVVLIFFV